MGDHISISPLKVKLDSFDCIHKTIMEKPMSLFEVNHVLVKSIIVFILKSPDIIQICMSFLLSYR